MSENLNSIGNKPTIVFCHGLWADGSCFNKLIPSLIADGYNVMSAQYGLDSYQQDVDAIRKTLNRIEGKVILVGHSYGGATITAAGNDEKVVGLIYIAALAPDAGETAQSQTADYPAEVFNHIEISDGRIWLLPEGTKYFAGDLSTEEQNVIFSTHYPPAVELLGQQDLSNEEVAWRKKPCWYIVSAEDKTVSPDLQRVLANRMNAKITELQSSHVSMLSHPNEVLEVIRSAAMTI